MRFTGERVVPDLPALRATFLQSKAVYEFAARRVEGQQVLDCGAGEGYGPALLAEHAACVVALDYSKEAVEFASRKYGGSRGLFFANADASALPFAENSFDTLCCFQVLEHLEDAPSFLFEAKRVLRPGGALIITTPNRFWAGTGPNPHHVLEYDADELRELLELVFPSVEMLGVFGSERVMSYRAKNRRIVSRLIALDVFGLRYRLPERIREPIHASLTRIIRTFTRRQDPQGLDELTTDDYPILGEGIEQSIDLMAVATNAAKDSAGS
jgi:ubiquinone/menaquinone biosynthesis C-methylase UbiE